LLIYLFVVFSLDGGCCIAELFLLQAQGQFHFFAHKEFYPNPPWSLSLLIYFEATTKYLGSLLSPPISLPPSYDSFVLGYVDSEVVE